MAQYITNKVCSMLTITLHIAVHWTTKRISSLLGWQNYNEHRTQEADNPKKTWKLFPTSDKAYDKSSRSKLSHAKWISNSIYPKWRERPIWTIG